MQKNTRTLSRKLVHKQKKTAYKKRKLFLKYFFYVFSKPYLFKNILTAFILSILLIFTINKIKHYSENIIPTLEDVEINNPQVYKIVYSDLINLIKQAEKNNEKRSTFLIKVNNLLYSFDNIDEYWIHLGLDHKLQINATLQVPLVKIETKNRETFVVSNKFKIIAKNPPKNEFLGLYNLYAPELKIVWKPKYKKIKPHINEITKDITLYYNTEKIFSSNQNTVNIAWLINETKSIYTHFQILQSNYSLSKLTWDSKSGFQLNLSSNIIVKLGKENLKEKIEKLNLLLKNLEQKKIHPFEIDLNYNDKASFKGLN